MSVIAICGLPGTGKTLFSTYLMCKKYKKENRWFRCLLRKGSLNNNVFSNYPIKLNKKHYSNQVSLYDLKKYKKWYMDSDIVLDEFQLYCDSIDFKNFPSKVRNFFQLHRHFGVNNIYVLSQDPSRIVKQVRVLICEYYEIVKFFKIPFLGIGMFRYNIFYNDEDYGKSVKVKKEDVQYKFKKRIRFVRYKKIYKAYNTKYMRCLVDNEPYFERNEFKDKYMSMSEVDNTFHFKEKEDQEQMEQEVKKLELEKRRKKLGLMEPLHASAPRRISERVEVSEIVMPGNNELVKTGEAAEFSLDQVNIANNVDTSKEIEKFPFDVS